MVEICHHCTASDHLLHTSPILLAEVGKAPDIAEAHAEPQHRQQKLKHIHKEITSSFLYERIKINMRREVCMKQGSVLDYRDLLSDLK